MNKPRTERQAEETVGRILIADPNALAAIILDVVGRKFDGNVSAAARWVHDELDPTLGRISQPTLQRLSKGTSRSMKELTLWGLVALVGEENYERLGWTILSRSARERLDEFESFCARRGLRGSKERSITRNAILTQMRKDEPAEFEEFDSLVQDRRHTLIARDLALDRVAEPFVLAGEGGLIERDWDELSPGEKRRYLKHALKRELVLLSRPPDLQRAQALGLDLLRCRLRRGSPKTLSDWLEAESFEVGPHARRLVVARSSAAIR